MLSSLQLIFDELDVFLQVFFLVVVNVAEFLLIELLVVCIVDVVVDQKVVLSDTCSPSLGLQ